MSAVFPESPLGSTSGLLPGATADIVLTSETVPATATATLKPAQALRSRVSLEASEISDDGWTEAMASIDRDGEPDPEMAAQILLMTPAEMEALYKSMKLHYEQGIWSTGTVER